jgi:hypothetical protein
MRTAVLWFTIEFRKYIETEAQQKKGDALFSLRRRQAILTRVLQNFLKIFTKIQIINEAMNEIGKLMWPLKQ